METVFIVLIVVFSVIGGTPIIRCLMYHSEAVQVKLRGGQVVPILPRSIENV